MNATSYFFNPNFDELSNAKRNGKVLVADDVRIRWAKKYSIYFCSNTI